jgi:hypothetical protein
MPKKAKKKRQRQSGVPSPSWGMITGGNIVIRRRLSLPSVTVAAAAYGTSGSGTDVNSTTEFASLAGLYASYRVLGMKIHFTNAASVSAQGYLLVASYRNGNVPVSTNAALWSGENPTLFDPASTTIKNPHYVVKAKSPSEVLWVNSIGPSVQPVGVFGFKVYNGGGGGMLYWVEYSVEFRSQA